MAAPVGEEPIQVVQAAGDQGEQQELGRRDDVEPGCNRARGQLDRGFVRGGAIQLLDAQRSLVVVSEQHVRNLPVRMVAARRRP